MLNQYRANGADEASPENGEGCQPASCAPFKTSENTHRDFAATANAAQADLRDESCRLARLNLSMLPPSLRAVGDYIRLIGSEA